MNRKRKKCIVDRNMFLHFYRLWPWVYILVASWNNDVVDGTVKIKASRNYYVPYQLVEVNCTSSIPIQRDSITILINYVQVALLFFLRSNNTCNIFKKSELVECTDECRCSLDGKSFAWIYNATRDDSNFTVRCAALPGETDSTVIRKAIPVSLVSLSPSGSKNEVIVIIGTNQTFTCTTDKSRPASFIQWYLGDRNLTNFAHTRIVPDDSDNFTSYTISTLVYSGTYSDNFKELYCLAADVYGFSEIRSTQVALIINGPISISGSYDKAIIQRPYTITCSGLPNNIAILLYSNYSPVAVFIGAFPNNTCKLAGSYLTNYTYRCVNNTMVVNYQTTIPGELMTENMHLSVWKCDNPYTRETDSLTLEVNVPIANVTISPAYKNNVASVVDGGRLNFTCTTNAGRPAAAIQWYINDVNITDQAKLSITEDGNKFISASVIILTGRDSDHGNLVHCEALNVDQLKSTSIMLDIHVPVTELTVIPVGTNDVITVISERNSKFTCTTGPSRPAAMIHWYVGTQNVTNDSISHTPQPNGTLYVSSSTLVYTAIEKDNGTKVHCEASNIEGEEKVKSTDKTIHIVHLPDKVKDVRVMCFDTELGVTWRSESDRGNQQVFHVIVKNLETDKVFYSDKLSDPGVGTIQQYTTQLSAATSYIIFIESTNIYGTVRSDAVRYCNTTGLATMAGREETLSFTAGFGSGAALIVFINIIAVILIFMIKRRLRISERSKVYEQTKQGPSDSNVYNELDETQTGRIKSVQDYGNVAYEEITSTVDQTSASAKPRQN